MTAYSIWHSKATMVLKDHSKPMSTYVLSNPYKGRVPQYSRDKLDELQFNDLERKRVFVKREDAGITVE